MSAPLAAVDLQGPVTDGFRTVATFVPKLVGFLVIVLLGYLIGQLGGLLPLPGGFGGIDGGCPWAP